MKPTLWALCAILGLGSALGASAQTPPSGQAPSPSRFLPDTYISRTVHAKFREVLAKLHSDRKSGSLPEDRAAAIREKLIAVMQEAGKDAHGNPGKRLTMAQETTLTAELSQIENDL